MFKVANLNDVRAILGKVNGRMTPSAFADFLALLQRDADATPDRPRFRSMPMLITDERGVSDNTLDLYPLLPVQLMSLDKDIYQILWKDDLEASIRVRRALFGEQWLTVTIREDDTGSCMASIAPSGKLGDEEAYVTARGLVSKPVAHLAACARGIDQALRNGDLYSAVQAFAEAASGRHPKHVLQLCDLLPKLIGEASLNATSALKERDMRAARSVQVLLSQDRWRASLVQAEEDADLWICRMRRAGDPVPQGLQRVEEINTPACLDAATAMLLGAFMAYEQEISGSHKAAA
jgi:hypothetical protein